MGKYIYKITNLINNKCYIGQTQNYKNRFAEHKRLLRQNKHENSHLQFAWNRYGESNFSFDIIEYTENYNDREKYYIAYYHSNNSEYGYNILSGGEEPPVRRGEDNVFSKLTQIEVDAIIEMLLSDKSIDSINLAFPHITRSQIWRINSGDAWYRNDLSYPLREPDNIVGSDVANKIVYDLQYSNLTQKQIAQKYGVARTCVTAINNGNVYAYRDEQLTYPIRQTSILGAATDDVSVVNNIIQDLRYSNISLIDISKKYNVCASTINDINYGRKKKYNDPEQTYPLRKRSTTSAKSAKETKQITLQND